MDSDKIVVLVAFVVTAILLLSRRVPSYFAFWGPVTIVVGIGAGSVDAMLQAFSTTTLLTISMLLLLSEGLTNAGLDQLLWTYIMPNGRGKTAAMLCIAVFVPIASAFMNNTAVVSFLIPPIIRWATCHDRGSGKFLMPLSFLSALGGSLTTIGSSTNLVALEIAQLDLSFYALVLPGLGVLFAGTLYTLLTFDRLLPDNKESMARAPRRSAKLFTVVCVVPTGHSLIGARVKGSDPATMEDVKLQSIKRKCGAEVKVEEETTYAEGDILTFVGTSQNIFLARYTLGLVSANLAMEEVGRGTLIEAVVSRESSLVGTYFQESVFTANHDAKLLRVYRSGTLMYGPVNEIVLQHNDVLIIECQENDLQCLERQSNDFSLFVSMSPYHPVDKWQMIRLSIALVAFFACIILSLFFWDLPRFLLLLAFAAWVTGFINSSMVQNVTNANGSMLMTVAGALALSNIMQEVGLSDEIGSFVSELNKLDSDFTILLICYLIAVGLSSFVNNNAAVALIIPGLQSSDLFGTSIYERVIFAVIMGASHSFMIPAGYQTNLMVQIPGRYSDKDFWKFGGPLQLVVFPVTLLVLSFDSFDWLIDIALGVALVAVAWWRLRRERQKDALRGSGTSSLSSDHTASDCTPPPKAAEALNAMV
eukprot:Clim_evm227s157 gene=Clim_evmTU227s157